jgi:hypothetical protein
MRSKILTSMILFACLLLIGGFPPLCGAEDYAAKKGVALHRADLQKMVQQIVKLDPKEKDQRDFLDRLFQMKLAEAERMFQVCGDAKEVKRQVAEIYLLKAIEADAMGSWIQAYFALQSSEAWNKEALTQYLQIGEKGYRVAAFAKELEKKLQRWGNNVRFVIKPFSREKMFQPDRVVLARSEEEEKKRKAASSKPSQGRLNRDSSGGRWDAIEESPKKMGISPRDKAYLLDRFNKALYAFYYNPIQRNAEFDLFLPYGEYHLYEKDFTIHPVEFEVSGRSTQVVLRPARWFRLTVSEEVHPENVRLSFHGKEWRDLNHVPFGSYRVRVKSNEYTAPAAQMTFVPKGSETSEEEAAASGGEVVVVEDRGVYKMTLRERKGNEKLRQTLLGF